MKKFIITFFVALCFSLSLAAVPGFAQFPVPVGPGDGDNNTTPIGGMAVLAALGGGYAIKKLYDGKHKT